MEVGAYTLSIRGLVIKPVTSETFVVETDTTALLKSTLVKLACNALQSFTFKDTDSPAVTVK